MLDNIHILVEGLANSNAQQAYACLQQLQKESELSSLVYPYFDLFANMLSSDNSYIRTRGLILIAYNAKWDTEYKIDEIIDTYLKHITDDKPITARRCIKVLPLVAKHKPDLKQDIVNALHRANLGKYKTSMLPLIVKDIQKALDEIKSC